MKKHIILINPWIHDFAAYDFWAKPIGILYIASYLRLNGYEVTFIDCLDPYHPDMIKNSRIKNPKRHFSGKGQFHKEIIDKPSPIKFVNKNYKRYGITPDCFLESLRRAGHPSFIFITSKMSYWYPGVFETIKLTRNVFPDAPVLLGGNYVTLCPEHAKKSGADYLISSNAESRMESIIRDILHGNISFVPDITKLDSLPYPSYDLLNRPDQLPILTARGCPFKCTYCASKLLFPQYSQRDPIMVVDEIEHWNRTLGVNNFSFYDDALLIEPDKMIIPFMEEVINRRLSLSFHCPNGLHLSQVSEKVANLLYRSGFRTIRFGFETSNVERQSETGGKVRNEHLEEAVVHLKNAGYRTEDIGVYVMCGLPGQSAEEVLDTIHFVDAQKATPVIAEYSPIPGTALWDKAVECSHYDLVNEPLFHNNSLLPCHSDILSVKMYENLKRETKAIRDKVRHE
ncbi:MAG: radical SAM protein [Candidatus Omnitrophica bacterium]|nr:radical SAM protein [Candidatus Omnitrophota bacterium]